MVAAGKLGRFSGPIRRSGCRRSRASRKARGDQVRRTAPPEVLGDSPRFVKREMHARVHRGKGSRRPPGGVTGNVAGTGSDAGRPHGLLVLFDQRAGDIDTRVLSEAFRSVTPPVEVTARCIQAVLIESAPNIASSDSTMPPPGTSSVPIQTVPAA